MLQYKFTTSPYGQKGIKIFGVEVLDNRIEALREISGTGWTQDKIQAVIDASKALNPGEEYTFQVPGSDLLIRIFTDRVYFFDYRSQNETEDFWWTFTQFIDFMTHFKAFVAQNG